MLRMRGESGELRRSYQVAARLGPWHMDENGRVDVDSAETFEHFMELPEPPLTLRLRLGRRAWCWQEVQVIQSGQHLVLKVVGSPTVRDA